MQGFSLYIKFPVPDSVDNPGQFLHRAHTVPKPAPSPAGGLHGAVGDTLASDVVSATLSRQQSTLQTSAKKHCYMCRKELQILVYTKGKQNAGVTQWDRQHLWIEGMPDVLDRDPSLD